MKHRNGLIDLKTLSKILLNLCWELHRLNPKIKIKKPASFIIHSFYKFNLYKKCLLQML